MLILSISDVDWCCCKLVENRSDLDVLKSICREPDVTVAHRS
jgi:hypothetical protein